MSRNAANSEFQVTHPKQWLKLFGGLLLIGTCVGLGGIWFYNVAKVWRAHSLVAEASDLTLRPANGQVESKLIAAYHLAPQDAQVLRACAQYELVTGNVHCLGFYHLLILLPSATREDQRNALRACLVFGELAAAEQLAGTLNALDPGAEDVALAGEVHWHKQEKVPAIALMRQSLAMDPSNRPHQFLLAEMLIHSGGTEEQEEALHLLRSLTETKDAEGLKALITLSRIRNLDRGSQREILTQIRQHPLLDDPGRFAAWDLEAHLGDRDATAVLQDAADSFKAEDDTRKSAVARWLFYQEQAPQLALKLATLADSAHSQELLLVRLDSLGYLKRWPEVEQELEDPQLLLSPALAFRYRARAALEMGDVSRSQNFWDQARIAAATEGSTALAELGNYLLTLGLYDEAKKTFSRMAQSPGQAEAGYTALVQVETQHGSNAELLATLKQMMTDLPALPEPKNDWAYLNLLLNTNVDESWKLARALVDAHPRILAYRSTLALGDLRRHDIPAALQVYDSVNIEWNTASAHWKMIHAVVLAAAGDKERALAFASDINRSQLRPEEIALFEMYLPSQETGPPPTGKNR